MRLSHLLFAAAVLLPLSAQAITIDKLGGHWVNTDITCKQNLAEGDFCEFVITPRNKSIAAFNFSQQGKKVGRAAMLAVSEEDVWAISAKGVPYGYLEHEDGMLYDDGGNKYYRVSK